MTMHPDEVRRLEVDRMVKRGFAQHEPRREELPIISTPRGTTLQSAKRPLDEFTVEEQREHLASIAGPMRVFAANITRVNLKAGAAEIVARGVEWTVKYVRVRAVAGQAAAVVLFSSQGSGSPDASEPVTLGGDPFFEAVILPNETLYAFCDVAFRLKVQEVTP
jgi:hypothetical protein